MFSEQERMVFIGLVVICGALAWPGFYNMFKIIRKGGEVNRFDNIIKRFLTATIDVLLQKPIFKTRPFVSILHAFIFFGFSFYLLVNVSDLLEAFVEGWTTIDRGPIFGTFNLLADLFSVLVLVGMISMLYRRFVVKPKAFEFNDNVLLHPKVAKGSIKKDSLFVGIFILLHVGSRWVGTAIRMAEEGHTNAWLPTASLLVPLFSDMSPESLEQAFHITWWIAMGLIVMFIPYFPRSKHIHLMIAPINLALGRNTPVGALDPVTDYSSPGASGILELPWPQLLDPYACIMCTRCHEVCPAHESGTSLSPSALEINKRYLMNESGSSLAAGEDIQLLDSAISSDAVWSCTTCNACVSICPVGNEPMQDIIQMRRSMVFDSNMPDELADTLRSLDEQGNSFGESNRKRSRWTKPLNIDIKDASKEAVDILWFVGDFASFNQSCTDTTRKVAEVLTAAGVDFGIIKKGEKSAGNDVRRVGEEGLFESLAEQNIEKLAGCEFNRIMTTDPHTFNALKNEYPALGGEYEVVHYSTLLLEMMESGIINLDETLSGNATYHDPCYLGRYNGIYEAPRGVIERCGLSIVEMPRNRDNSLCCGAGGGQIWMNDHDDMTQRPSEMRIEEALSVGVSRFLVACPKDMTMYSDAVKTSGHEGEIIVEDIIDLVYSAMNMQVEKMLPSNVDGVLT
ncbi:MAG: heterodisulfide reductase [Euryarchaeota archaeon]|jgi:Fe-S oxidoreductase|nr:heterodisulfide reductase [Euryarchaeota archaeon]|tara:strand:- start:7455 stop:9500 length:2046 start_codon:yes stop_codon:yes gene_type:complete